MRERIEEVHIFFDERGQVFQDVMPLAMGNLVVAQHCHKTRFFKVRVDGWDGPKPRILVKDFVMMNRPTKGALCILTHPQMLLRQFNLGNLG